MIPTRERLPTTRPGFIHKFEVGGYEGYIRISLFPDGRVGELFVDMQKEGSTIGGLIDAWAIAVSHLLQRGMTTQELADKFCGLRFEPNDSKSSSIVDYICRWLLIVNEQKEV